MAASLLTALLLLLLTPSALVHDPLEGLSWCSNYCLCDRNSDSRRTCFPKEHLFSLLDFRPSHIVRLQKSNWSFEDKVEWCDDLCMCFRGTKDLFRCVNKDAFLRAFKAISQISQKVKAGHQEEFEVQEFVPLVEDDLESIPTKEPKNEKLKKARKVRRFRKKDEDLNRIRSVEAPYNESYILTDNFKTTESPTKGTPVPGGHEDSLPRKEAVAASPSVIAKEPPMVRNPSRKTPRVIESPPVEGLNPAKMSPILEIPLERKTVAGEVSRDLQELREDVDAILKEVVLNQQMLLLALGLGGLAAIGVLILAIRSFCCWRRSEVKSPKKASDNAGGENQVTKVNLEEAW